MKPRVLFVARDRYDLPLSPSRARKFDALSELLDVRMLAVGTGSGDDRFTLLPMLPRLDGPAYWSLLPARLALEGRRFRPAAVVAQSPFDGAVAVTTRVSAPVVVELHGDWRTFARLYGSPLRRVIVGSGSRATVVEELVRAGLATWDRALPTDEVARAMDDASVVVLPSRSEGMGRVVVEALLRGRPVVGSNLGGIRDPVRDGTNALLVEPAPQAIAAGLTRALSDRALLEGLAAAAPASAGPWVATPEEYARRTAELVERVAA